ncbi:hypothetical protein GCM10023108_19310 [Saccharopolyspora hordei]
MGLVAVRSARRDENGLFGDVFAGQPVLARTAAGRVVHCGSPVAPQWRDEWGAVATPRSRWGRGVATVVGRAASGDPVRTTEVSRSDPGLSPEDRGCPSARQERVNAPADAASTALSAARSGSPGSGGVPSSTSSW